MRIANNREGTTDSCHSERLPHSDPCTPSPPRGICSCKRINPGRARQTHVIPSGFRILTLHTVSAARNLQLSREPGPDHQPGKGTTYSCHSERLPHSDPCTPSPPRGICSCKRKSNGKGTTYPCHSERTGGPLKPGFGLSGAVTGTSNEDTIRSHSSQKRA